MRQAATQRRWLPKLGERQLWASTSAITSPPPGPGEIKRTALPDTFDGIRFEIGRMAQYVTAARTDPIVVANTEFVCSRHIGALERAARMNGHTLDGANPEAVCVEAIDQWCREHFVYVNDPPNIEVIQTPRRMIQITRVSPEVIRHILGPLLDVMAQVAGGSAAAEYEPPPVCAGDCDEGSTLFLSKCGACTVARIRPLLFEFGGHDGTIHHVWGRVGIGEKFLDSDLTEPGYALGDYSKFPHYEQVEIPLDDQPAVPARGMGNELGIAEIEEEDPQGELPDDLRRLADKVANGRKDALLVDCARIIGVHYGKMVEHFSAREKRPVSAHNNKVLFLEGFDTWCRAWLSPAPRAASGTTEDPREVIAHIMRPWYEALELDNPAQYQMRPQEPPPAYVGSPEDATCMVLALAACLDITPVRFAFGMRDDQPERMWGKVKADGEWYDTDVNEPFSLLGDRPDYPKYEEVEVPL
jgi:hypothetical protein